MTQKFPDKTSSPTITSTTLNSSSLFPTVEAEKAYYKSVRNNMIVVFSIIFVAGNTRKKQQHGKNVDVTNY